MKNKFTKKELKEFKLQLQELKRKISSEIRHLTEENIAKSQRDASGELSSYTYHMADMASDSFDREFAYTLASNEQELIYLISEALVRIDNNEFGICENCVKPITKKRLRAVPYAKHCIKCQEEEEKRAKKEPR